MKVIAVEIECRSNVPDLSAKGNLVVVVVVVINFLCLFVICRR